MPAYQTRGWCFTLFEEPTFDRTIFQYVVMGTETCPTTGKTHWQGYAENHKPASMAAMKKKLNDNKAHLEKRKGTQEEAANYCKKDGNFEEHGELGRQGKRTDLYTIADDLKTKKRKLSDIKHDDTELYCRYRGGIEAIAEEVDNNSSRKWRSIEQIVYVGLDLEVVGKKATQDYPNARWVNIESNMVWDFYRGEDTIIVHGTRELWISSGAPKYLHSRYTTKYALWTRVIWIVLDHPNLENQWWSNDKYKVIKV